MLTKTRVIPMQVNAFCDECGSRLIFTGKCLMSLPEKYEHKCIDCFNVEHLNSAYPRIEYEEDNNENDTTEFDKE